MRLPTGATIIALAALAAACTDQPLSPSAELGPSAALARAGGPGAVYLMSNDPTGNTILAYEREADGALGSLTTHATGGVGTGGGLGNQGSLALTRDHRRLYAVNAGSNDISAFDLSPDGPRLIGSPVHSEGELPVSVTVHGSLLYVLNAGASGTIAGFHIGRDGELEAIPGSSRPLSSAAAGAAQISFTPNGRSLVVTEKATNVISTYTVGSDGIASGPYVHASAGETPFGFAFNRTGDLVVSEAFGGQSEASTASSYRVGPGGDLTLISAAVATTQTAACWLAISQDGRFAFTTNTGSGSVSSISIDQGGRIELADAEAGVTGSGSRPQDAAFTPGGRFLYVRNAGGNVSAFRIGAQGTLTHVGDFGTLPAGANGMVAR